MIQWSRFSVSFFHIILLTNWPSDWGKKDKQLTGEKSNNKKITYRVPYYQSYNILRTWLSRTLLIYLAQQFANVHFSCNICQKKRINQRKLLFNVLKYGSQM